MKNTYKKLIFIFFLSTFSLLIIIKYSISFFKNEILNLIKSDYFDTFIINVLDDKLEKLANSEIPEQKKSFYKSNIEKIIIKIEELN
tara:strand:+ start:138 stop:398 length:261 start_codon:yes stop_codon:yes gene_type:complete